MKQNKTMTIMNLSVWVLLLLAFASFTAEQTTLTTKAKYFPTAEGAANALIEAAEKFDEIALVEILGPLPGVTLPPTMAVTTPPTIAATKAARMPMLPASAPSEANESSPSGRRIPSATTAAESAPRSSPAIPLVPNIRMRRNPRA